MGSHLVIRNNIRRSLHHKLLWIIVFLAPILLSYVVNLFDQLAQTTYRIGVISYKEMDSDRNIDVLIAKLNRIDGITAKKADKESYQTDIIMGSYHFGINLDKLNSNFEIEDMDEVTLEEALVSYQDQDEVKHFIQYLKKQPVKPTSEILSPMERSIAFLTTLFMVISVLHAGMYIRDKQEGLLMRYCYSPKRKISYLFGNYIYILLITFVQVGISYFIMNLLQKNRVAIPQFLMVVGILSVVTSMFAIIISSLSKSEVHASITASSVTAVLSLLSGTFVSISQLPSILQYTGVVNPIRWCIELYEIIF